MGLGSEVTYPEGSKYSVLKDFGACVGTKKPEVRTTWTLGNKVHGFRSWRFGFGRFGCEGEGSQLLASAFGA